MPRIAAVDYGLKRIGLAVSDESGKIALPLKMIAAGKNVDESIRNLLNALAPYSPQLETIVIGLPLLLNGKAGDMAADVQRFASALRGKTQVAVETLDERLTSSHADRLLKELDYSRKERSHIIDSTSALLLLQTYLEIKALGRKA
jgi:putative holliday junction resolvase